MEGGEAEGAETVRERGVRVKRQRKREEARNGVYKKTAACVVHICPAYATHIDINIAPVFSARWGAE